MYGNGKSVVHMRLGPAGWIGELNLKNSRIWKFGVRIKGREKTVYPDSASLIFCFLTKIICLIRECHQRRRLIRKNAHFHLICMCFDCSSSLNHWTWKFWHSVVFLNHNQTSRKHSFASTFGANQFLGDLWLSIKTLCLIPKFLRHASECQRCSSLQFVTSLRASTLSRPWQKISRKSRERRGWDEKKKYPVTKLTVNVGNLWDSSCGAEPSKYVEKMSKRRETAGLLRRSLSGRKGDTTEACMSSRAQLQKKNFDPSPQRNRVPSCPFLPFPKISRVPFFSVLLCPSIIKVSKTRCLFFTALSSFLCVYRGLHFTPVKWVLLFCSRLYNLLRIHWLSWMLIGITAGALGLDKRTLVWICKDINLFVLIFEKVHINLVFFF